MPKRILLVHAYLPSMQPIVDAFKAGWPEAELLNLLDESLYADVTPEGVMKPGVTERIAGLLEHCVESGADGIVFTGSTFGPAVDEARQSIPVPVLKADEAMAERAIAKGGRILLVSSAMRAIPILRANLEAVAARVGVSPEIDAICVAGAKDAISAGDHETHDRLIAEAVVYAQEGYDSIAFGQMSMVPARALLSPELAARVLTTPEATVGHLRALLEPR